MSKNFWDLLEESYPDKEQREYLIARATDQENGAIYALPSMEISEIDCMDYQVYINTAWLKKLNLKKVSKRTEKELLSFRAHCRPERQ